MKRVFILAGLLLAFPVKAEINPESCALRGCMTEVSFASASNGHSYGLLLSAPHAGCHRVRFRVEDGRARVLGQSPPLAPGELAVIRLGRGFPQGENVVTVASVGCDRPPAATRRVVLSKNGPDHSWRARGL